MLRIACDTGVIFSGLFFRGKPNRVIELAKEGRCTLLISEYVRDELYGVTKAKGRSNSCFKLLLCLENVRVIANAAYDSKENFSEARKLVRDRKDWPVYAFFRELQRRGQADLFVSSDSDLLEVPKSSPLSGKIMSPAQIFEIIGQ